MVLLANPQFLTTFTISLMKSIDIRSEAAVNLLAEFLDMDAVSGVNAQAQVGGDRELRKNAEHFAHGEFYFFVFFFTITNKGLKLSNFFLKTEVYCYLRSPYRDLSVYDSVVQVGLFSSLLSCHFTFPLHFLPRLPVFCFWGAC